MKHWTNSVLEIILANPTLTTERDFGHIHPKEHKSFNNGFGVAKQKLRILRRDTRKFYATDPILRGKP